jgi:hypothetical protein
MIKDGTTNDCDNSNRDLYVVNEVTGVDPYKRYVDKWNQVPGDSGGGEDTIKQHDTDGTVNERALEREATVTAAATKVVGEFDFQVPISGTVITPREPNTPRGVPQVGGRPTRVRKQYRDWYQVSRVSRTVLPWPSTANRC